MKYLAVINENSGTVMRIGPKTVAEIVTRKAGDGAKIVIGDCKALIAAAKEDGETFDGVICAGGDGTQAAIAGALRGKNAALLPLPCGTMNLLCRDLGIPLEIDKALEIALTAPVRRIDVGLAGERSFLNNVVFGSYAELAQAREELREMESIDDLGAAIVDAADALLHADPIRFSLKLDGEPTDAKTNTVIVSINKITDAENMIPRRDRLADGELVVYLTESNNGADFASIILDFAKGEADVSERIESHSCQRCQVDGRGRKLSYTIDGDPLESATPIELKVEKKSVKVFYPNADRKLAAAE